MPVLLGTLSAWGESAAPRPGPAPDFNREVRPILARHCLKCHGPDDGQRQAKLRLDLRDAALRGGASGKAGIVPGKPERSEVFRRVSLPSGPVMPPAAANNPLTAAERETLRRWIAGGAAYQQHWAFVAPARPVLPKVKSPGWARNPIDLYVLARLEKEGLQPSPEVDPYTLVRRVYLDLIGLPPTPEEVDQFVRDCESERPELSPRTDKSGQNRTSVTSPTPYTLHPTPYTAAYERLVDRLLASPHYGERWARKWLDLARYADTNGYEKDRPRSIWPYRDWVIHALNQDMPFDRFTVEQLAGDMLPNATPEQRIATGFHRNTMLNEEGGIDPLEYRYYAMVDRVSTTATTWLGLTLGCAQCHTHKFDPIPHREYYQFMAFLDNADEPELEVERPDVAAKRAEIAAKAAALEQALPSRFPDGEENLQRRHGEWLQQQQARAVEWTVLRPTQAKSNLPLLTVLDDASVLASGDMSKRDVYDLTLQPEAKGITALRLEVLPDDRLPKRGPGRVYYEGPHGDFFLSEVTLAADGKPVKLAKAVASYPSAGAASAALDGDPQTGWTINGGQGQAHTAVFRLAEAIGEAGEVKLQLLFERYHAAGLGRFRISVSTDPRAGEAALPPDVEAALARPAGERTAAQNDRLFRYYLSVAPELAAAREEIKKLRDSMPALPTTLVFSERPAENPRPTFVHHRGEFLQPKERVEPATLSVLPPLPAGAPRNRLSFARWLVDPRNPLVGRVTVNRQWAAFFGRGLVRTTEDFGYQGEAPSHPELLDYLAWVFTSPGNDGAKEQPISRGRVPLVGHDGAKERGSDRGTEGPDGLGWSLKKLHRLIVLSSTYRQSSALPQSAKSAQSADSSRPNPQSPKGHPIRNSQSVDPENRLLGRGPRVRLEAELIRDAALRASGLLSEKIGGPSVFPPQPPGVTSEGTYGPLQWRVSEGEDRYRRGLYTFAKRTAPYAMFLAFDAPSGEACVARREVSNSPLQALTLLNDAVFVEAAQALGKRAAALEGSPEARATLVFRRCLTRPPSTEELALLVRFYETQKGRFAAKELDAGAVAGPGEGDPVERAAWTSLARSLLNLDEAIVKP